MRHFNNSKDSIEKLCAPSRKYWLSRLSESNLWSENHNRQYQRDDFISKNEVSTKSLRENTEYQVQPAPYYILGNVFQALWNAYVKECSEFLHSSSVDYSPKISCHCQCQESTESTFISHILRTVDQRDINNRESAGPLLRSVYYLSNLLKIEQYEKLVAVIDRFDSNNCGVIQNWQSDPTVLAYCNSLYQSQLIKDLYMALRNTFLFSNVDSLEEFVNNMKQMWFDGFSDCGFHHIYVGKFSFKRATGLHSWVRVLQLEEKNALEYLGYYSIRRDIGLANIAFRIYDGSWKLKKLSSMLIGVPPEFETGMYSVISMISPNKPLQFKLNNSYVTVKSVVVKKSRTITTTYISDCLSTTNDNHTTSMSVSDDDSS